MRLGRAWWTNPASGFPVWGDRSGGLGVVATPFLFLIIAHIYVGVKSLGLPEFRRLVQSTGVAGLGSVLDSKLPQKAT